MFASFPFSFFSFLNHSVDFTCFCVSCVAVQLPVVFAPDTQNYSVVVENPRKVGDKNAYVAYTVRVTRTAENTTTVVDRRYSDFDWLCEHLKASHPSCVVPQIPEKTFSLSQNALLPPSFFIDSFVFFL